MFEQSFVTSQVGRMSPGARLTWAGSVVLQCCAAALLVMVPMLHPERIGLRALAPRAFVPLHLDKPRPVAVVRRVEAASSSMATAALSAPSVPRMTSVPSRIPHGLAAGDPPPMTGSFEGMATELPGAVAMDTPGTRVSVPPMVRSMDHGLMRVSSGIGVGMLIGSIRPVYPSIARAAHVSGAVVVEATISRDGRIERAHVVSGPAMLATAALDAVQAARYTPYRLNGTAVDVETTITVNFRIGG